MSSARRPPPPRASPAGARSSRESARSSVRRDRPRPPHPEPRVARSWLLDLWTGLRPPCPPDCGYARSAVRTYKRMSAGRRGPTALERGSLDECEGAAELAPQADEERL